MPDGNKEYSLHKYKQSCYSKKMGNKRHRHQNRPDDRKSISPAKGDLSDPNSLPLRLPTLLSLVAILAVYGWMLSWSNWFLYTHYTTHVQDNFRVLTAFYKLLGTIDFNVIETNLRDVDKVG